MNKKIKYLFCLFIACLAVVLGSLNAKADFGNFSGNSDYGGGRRRSSSSGRSYNRGNSYNSGRSYTYTAEALMMTMMMTILYGSMGWHLQ